jgi:hypothetical protein
MFEREGLLRTWTFQRLPNADEIVSAEQLPDHRLAYLDYEGEVLGGRGIVSRVDAGTYEVVAESESVLTVRMTGQRLRGALELARDESEPHRWRVSFSPG